MLMRGCCDIVSLSLVRRYFTLDSLLTLGARMRSEGYGTWSVCVSVSTYSHTTAT